MMCPKCSADSSVLSTRAYKTVMTKRRRLCFNGHEFATVEVPIKTVSEKLLDSKAHATRRRANSIRVKKIVLDRTDLAATEVAAMLGISAVYARQIRAGS